MPQVEVSFPTSALCPASRIHLPVKLAAQPQNTICKRGELCSQNAFNKKVWRNEAVLPISSQRDRLLSQHAVCQRILRAVAQNRVGSRCVQVLEDLLSLPHWDPATKIIDPDGDIRIALVDENLDRR